MPSVKFVILFLILALFHPLQAQIPDFPGAEGFVRLLSVVVAVMSII